MLISGQYIYVLTIYVHVGGVNSGRHDSPYIRKLSLDHDSGEKNRGCHSVFQKYSTLLVFTSVTHSSPSLTASLAILVSKRSPFYEISQNLSKSLKISQKIGHVLRSGLLRPHSPVPQILYWSQTERLSWSLDCLPRKLGQPPVGASCVGRVPFECVSCWHLPLLQRVKNV